MLDPASRALRMRWQVAIGGLHNANWTLYATALIALPRSCNQSHHIKYEEIIGAVRPRVCLLDKLLCTSKRAFRETFSDPYRRINSPMERFAVLCDAFLDSLKDVDGLNEADQDYLYTETKRSLTHVLQTAIGLSRLETIETSHVPASAIAQAKAQKDTSRTAPVSGKVPVRPTSAAAPSLALNKIRQVSAPFVDDFSGAAHHVLVLCSSKI